MSLVEAVREGLRTRELLGVTGVATMADADRALALAGLERWPDEPMPGRLYGIYYRGAVQVRAGLQPGTALFVVAHELGHAVLGHGRGAYRTPVVGGGPEATPKEAEAQVFAYAFLLGAPAATFAGLNAQLQAGYEAGLPLGFLFGCVAVFGAALASA